MNNIISTRTCKKCAECCKNYPFIELSKTEISVLEQATGLRFGEFTNAKGKAVDEYYLQFKNNGDCFFLNDNSGSYSCSVYEARPGICKKYPLIPRQEEACESNRVKSLRNIRV